MGPTGGSTGPHPSGTRPIVVVTGASAGVGRATVRAFAREGSDLALIARGSEGLAATAREVEAAGGRALPLVADVANFDEVARAAERIRSELGVPEVWVNNAMTTVFGEFRDLRPEEFRRVTEVTYLGTVYGTLAALRLMEPSDRGAIIQVGSALAYRAIPLQSAYCGAKHAVRGFTDSVRCELLHRHSAITITTVHMPALNTPQFGWCRSRMPRDPQPVPPIFQPERAADAIVRAARTRPREVLVAGPTRRVVWANKFFPGFLDRYLGRKGYDAQMTDRSTSPDRSDNLFAPVPRDVGAHGAFDDRARR
jgi:NAD(P)-dependent dehydrogenase (short-subunit alcohol dehydrogenase family)